ncbi:MAG: hypothetical protein P8Y58_05330 [Novosphingobium sp.]
MSAQAGNIPALRQLGLTAGPVLIVMLAGMAVRLPVAAHYPAVALLLFLWIVSDTMMLALIARAPDHCPSRHAVLAVLAASSVTVALGAPAALRQALLAMPALMAAMAAVVMAHVAWSALRVRRAVRGAGSRRDRWLAAASEFLPPALVRFAAMELTVIHMALFRWGGPADVPPGSRAFAYHKHLTPLCAALLTLSGIEMAAYHLLLGRWSGTAALAMFVISDVGLVYLVGLIKSFRFRPVLMTPEGVRIRSGLLIDQAIPLDAIAVIETGFTGKDVNDPATFNAALLAWPNVLLRLNTPVPRRSLLRQRSFSAVAFRLDDPEPFVRLLRWRLGQL